MDEIIPISGKTKLRLSASLKGRKKGSTIIVLNCYRLPNWFDKVIDRITNKNREYIKMRRLLRIKNKSDDWKGAQGYLVTPHSTIHVRVKTTSINIPIGYSRNLITGSARNAKLEKVVKPKSYATI